MAIFSAMLMAAAATTCPAERAVYTMAEAPVYELRLPKVGPAGSVASDLFARISLPADGDRAAQTIWFLFTVSNGYQTTRIAPIADPANAAEEGITFLEHEGEDDGPMAGLTRFIAFDGDLTAAIDPPNAGDDAPESILLPDIGLALWYNPAAFGLTDVPAGGSVSVPTAMFRRTGCD